MLVPQSGWAEHRTKIYDDTARILTSTSFLMLRLTGMYVIDHFTTANFSPLYDVANQSWVDDLADDIIDLAILPSLMWSSDIVGGVPCAAADATGLAEGTPVTTGTIDATAEALSVGVSDQGDMMMYGSTIFIVLRTDARVTDPKLWYAPWLLKDEHASLASLQPAER